MEDIKNAVLHIMQDQEFVSWISNLKDEELQQLLLMFKETASLDEQLSSLAKLDQEGAFIIFSYNVFKLSKASKAARGTKLNYIKRLNGSCPEGYEADKFAIGGLVKCKKCKKGKKLNTNMNYKRRFDKGGATNVLNPPQVLELSPYANGLLGLRKLYEMGQMSEEEYLQKVNIFKNRYNKSILNPPILNPPITPQLGESNTPLLGESTTQGPSSNNPMTLEEIRLYGGENAADMEREYWRNYYNRTGSYRCGGKPKKVKRALEGTKAGYTLPDYIERLTPEAVQSILNNTLPLQEYTPSASQDLEWISLLLNSPLVLLYFNQLNRPNISRPNLSNSLPVPLLWLGLHARPLPQQNSFFLQALDFTLNNPNYQGRVDFKLGGGTAKRVYLQLYGPDEGYLDDPNNVYALDENGSPIVKTLRTLKNGNRRVTVSHFDGDYLDGATVDITAAGDTIPTNIVIDSNNPGMYLDPEKVLLEFRRWDSLVKQQNSNRR